MPGLIETLLQRNCNCQVMHKAVVPDAPRHTIDMVGELRIVSQDVSPESMGILPVGCDGVLGSGKEYDQCGRVVGRTGTKMHVVYVLATMSHAQAVMVSSLVEKYLICVVFAGEQMTV